MYSELLLCTVVELGGFEQRLRGNTARVEAGATEGGGAIMVLPLIYTGDTELVLRGTDGRRITGRAGADDDDVERIGGTCARVGAHDDPLGRDSALFFKGFPLREGLEK